MLESWNNLPCYMETDEVKEYYDIIEKKKFDLFIKRLFDIIFSLIMIIFIAPFWVIIYLIIMFDSPGNPIFSQNRITRYGRVFKILKFRTMVENAEQKGASVTTENDSRITKCGKWLRKYRIDETLQLINILKGELSFVGVRPESPKYVARYSKEMVATLLLPAGVTSPASILFKNESEMLKDCEDYDETYVNEILPKKMKYNLEYIKNFGFWSDIKIMFQTVLAVIKK